MADMLVKLYALPPLAPVLERLAAAGITLRRAQAAEAAVITGWARQHFSARVAGDCAAALANRPVSCFVAAVAQPAPAASRDPYDQPAQRIAGVACFDATRKGMFGPVGVRADLRRRGIGQALLLACLHAMKDEGYGYAVIGWAGDERFYAEAVGALPIPDSEPGVYGGPLVE